MRYLRRLTKVSPKVGRYLYLSIPTALCGMFPTDNAIVEPLPDGRGIIVMPARVEPLVGVMGSD